MSKGKVGLSMSGSRTVRQDVREAVLVESTDVLEVVRDVRIKDRLEEKAFSALEKKLEPRVMACRKCKGDGCVVCDESGVVEESVDMRAIELVLAPKFPKTSVNVNADLDGMKTEELLSMIEGF